MVNRYSPLLSVALILVAGVAVNGDEPTLSRLSLRRYYPGSLPKKEEVKKTELRAGLSPARRAFGFLSGTIQLDLGQPGRPADGVNNYVIVQVTDLRGNPVNSAVVRIYPWQTSWNYEMQVPAGGSFRVRATFRGTWSTQPGALVSVTNGPATIRVSMTESITRDLRLYGQ